jgi:hypothetical protein
VVASLLLVVAVMKEHGCTGIVVVAGIVAAGIAGDCPNSATIAVGVADPRVGYTPYDTFEEHR